MNDTESTENQAINIPQQPPRPTANKPRKLPWIILGIVLLLLGAAIAWLFIQLQSSNSQLSTTRQELASTQSKDTTATKTTSEPADTESDTSASSDSDETQIINTTIAYGTARAGSESAKLEVTINKKQSPFAEVNVGVNNESGYGCTLKKSKEIWIVLFCGQSYPPQSTLDQWGIPASFAKSDY